MDVPALVTLQDTCIDIFGRQYVFHRKFKRPFLQKYSHGSLLTS